MAQFYAVTPVSYLGNHIKPGTLLDSTTDAVTYNAYVNAGGLVAPAADTNVLAAAKLADSARQRGANDQELQTVMQAGLALDQGTNEVADLVSTSAGKGAALVGIQDVGNLITATTVEGALQELANGAIALQKRTVTLTFGAITATPDNVAQPFIANIGAVLPANAVVIAHESNVATLFSGGGLSAMKLDIGGTTPTAITNQQDVFTGAATGALTPYTGAHHMGKFSAEQLVATLTPDAGHKTSQATAGSVTITVWFAVIA